MKRCFGKSGKSWEMPWIEYLESVGKKVSPEEYRKNKEQYDEPLFFFAEEDTVYTEPATLTFK